MKRFKRIAAAVLALSLVASLAACGSKGLTETDAEVYVKGHLDAAYLGSFDQAYIDLVEDMTESDAQKMHDNNVSAEAEIFLYDYLAIEESDDALIARAEDFIREVYSHAKYTVGSASKTKDGDFVVEVTVSPIEVLPLLTEEDYIEALESSGYWDAATEEETAAADLVLGNLLLDLLDGYMSDLSYGKDQVIMLQLKPDDEGYYTLVDTGMQTLDACIIDYSGAYAQ